VARPRAPSRDWLRLKAETADLRDDGWAEAGTVHGSLMQPQHSIETARNWMLRRRGHRDTAANKHPEKERQDKAPPPGAGSVG
jgi:hypothetical protein